MSSESPEYVKTPFPLSSAIVLQTPKLDSPQTKPTCCPPGKPQHSNADEPRPARAVSHLQQSLVLDGGAHVAHLARHLEAGEHARGGGGGTDGTVLTVRLGTVGHSTALVVPALNGTWESAVREKRGAGAVRAMRVSFFCLQSAARVYECSAANVWLCPDAFCWVRVCWAEGGGPAPAFWPIRLAGANNVEASRHRCEPLAGALPVLPFSERPHGF